jgi:hypothetical protein
MPIASELFRRGNAHGHEKSATAKRIVNSVAYLAGPGKVTGEVLLVGGSAHA